MKKYIFFGKRNSQANIEPLSKEVMTEDNIAQIILDSENQLRKEKNKYRISHNEMKIVAKNAAKKIMEMSPSE